MTDRLTARKIADLLEGKHSFEGLNHREKVEQLTAIQAVWEAVQKAGWHEHTSDWDWRIHLDDGRGGFQSDFLPDADVLTWADSFHLTYAPGDPLPEDYCATVDYERISCIGVEVITESPEDDQGEAIIYYQIADLKSLTYEKVG